jgi:SAM-dependent methyltransferase
VSTGNSIASPVIAWHEVECGGYVADLSLWRELADLHGSPVFELGCGSGRVALELVGAGHEVVGVESDPELAAELTRRAAAAGVPIDVRVAEASALELERRAALVIAPMQLIQMLPDTKRAAVLAAIGRHLDPGGVAALAIVEPTALIGQEEAEVPLPDMRELDGCVYSSRPLWVESDERTIVVKRLRERVSPAGEIDRSVYTESLSILDAETLEREALAAALAPVGRRAIENGPYEADSTVVVVEKR